MLKLSDINTAVEKAVKDAKPSEIGAIVGAVVARELVKALASLEERLDDLQRKAMIWAGPHDIAREYAASDVVQRSGGLWIALVDTSAGDVPGVSPKFRRIAESRA